MTALPIYVVPQDVLRQKAEPVEGVTPEIKKLMENMLETMYAAQGIGLAAPQVGVSKRVVVIDVEQKENDGERGKPMFIVNPEIISSSEEISSYEEGCLSIPGQVADVKRPARVTVRYLDENGNAQQVDADGLLATCLQHEIDHLNGVLFIDHISSLKRDMILRKLKKWTKENAEEIAQTHVL